MNNFISPLYIQTNTLSSEKIVFGLLGVSGSTVYYQTSKQKLKVAGRLLSAETMRFIKTSIDTLRQAIQSQNKAVSATKGQLFGAAPSAFNEAYIRSLGQYSNGLIQFGDLLPVAGELNETLFLMLFEKFIGESAMPISIGQTDFSLQVGRILDFPKLADKADINYTLEPSKVSGLLKATTILLLTAHNKLVAIQKVDFTSTEVAVANRLYEFEAVVDVLNEYSDKHFHVPGEFKIVAELPTQPAQQAQFETIKRYKKRLFSVITVEQLTAEAKNIASNGHIKGSYYLEPQSNLLTEA